MRDAITQSKKSIEKMSSQPLWCILYWMCSLLVIVTLRYSCTQSDLKAAQNNLGLPRSGVTGVSLPCSRALQLSARGQKELQRTATPAEPEVNTPKFIIFFEIAHYVAKCRLYNQSFDITGFIVRTCISAQQLLLFQTVHKMAAQHSISLTDRLTEITYFCSYASRPFFSFLIFLQIMKLCEISSRVERNKNKLKSAHHTGLKKTFMLLENILHKHDINMRWYKNIQAQVVHGNKWHPENNTSFIIT